MSSPSGYREPLYIIKDIILTLAEYGELNQTSLISFCGLNLTKHKHFLDNLEENQMISKFDVRRGKQNVIIYKATSKGIEFCRTVLEPYEDIFPRKNKTDTNKGSNLNLLILV